MQVIFSRSDAGDLSGKVTWTEDESISKAKIVFISGYKRERLESWRGVLPKDGEEWECEFVRDTFPANPKKGAIVVHPIQLLRPLVTLKHVGQEVLGVQRCAQVTTVGNREIIVSDYRANNSDTKSLRNNFLTKCQGLAIPILDALRASRTHDVTASGVEIKDIQISGNVLMYRVDNLKIYRSINQIAGDLVRGGRITQGNLYAMTRLLGIPRLIGGLAVFQTPVGDFQLICEADAFGDRCTVNVIGVIHDPSRVKLEIVTPWGLVMYTLVTPCQLELLTNVTESAKVAVAYKVSKSG